MPSRKKPGSFVRVMMTVLAVVLALPVFAQSDGDRGEDGVSHIGYGPLSIRMQSAYQSVRLGILPRMPSTQAHGEHQLRIGATWSDLFPEISNQIVVGWKWELRPSGVLEAGILQNAVPYDASPDFGIHAAYTQRF